ncbi:MAG: phosphoribosylformylglycinamidine synthase subunit PurS [Gemmatimonadota bacterium]
MSARVEVFVELKPGLLDPQGTALEHALGDLGYAGIRNARVGRWITFALEADAPDLDARVEEMCQRLLANPVIERYRFTIRPDDAPGAAAP